MPSSGPVLGCLRLPPTSCSHLNKAVDPSERSAAGAEEGTATGAKLGEWVLPRAQGADENCTIHNYNIVPLRSGRYVVVSGNYRGGTWVTDFTDPANPVAVAWSDPVSLGPGPFCGGTQEFCLWSGHSF